MSETQVSFVNEAPDIYVAAQDTLKDNKKILKNQSEQFIDHCTYGI